MGRAQDYRGTVTCEIRGSVTRYRGTVYKPESDTRVFKQKYEGTVYKKGYTFNGVVKYVQLTN